MHMRFPPPGSLALVLILTMALFVLSASAQEPEIAAEPEIEPIIEDAPPPLPAPPSNFDATDYASKVECVFTLTWDLSLDDGAGLNNVAGYAMERALSPEGPFESIGLASPGATKYEDTTCEFTTDTYYRMWTISDTGKSGMISVGPVTAIQKWIDSSKTNIFVLGLIISVAIVYFISHAKSGKKLFIRKIAGLEAVDEAIGRATEMGRPILFIPGIMDMNDVQTVSAVIILGRIAKSIAEYETQLYCPTSKSLVMTTARETVKEAYMSAGRPDAYNDDMITYLTDEQFGYVAGVNGIMVREKPATCFYLGAFFAESLILAETGNSIGAIQIAGTAMPSQLPFFIAACDYTLIGEELFAASAYLSHEPMQLGSLKGQDVGKTIAMIAIIGGSLLMTLDTLFDVAFIHQASEWFVNLFAIN